MVQTSMATIHAFPARPEMRERLRLRSDALAAEKIAALPVIYDGGWYHQEAVEEDLRRARGETLSH